MYYFIKKEDGNKKVSNAQNTNYIYILCVLTFKRRLKVIITTFYLN